GTHDAGGHSRRRPRRIQPRPRAPQAPGIARHRAARTPVGRKDRGQPCFCGRSGAAAGFARAPSNAGSQVSHGGGAGSASPLGIQRYVWQGRTANFLIVRPRVPSYPTGHCARVTVQIPGTLARIEVMKHRLFALLLALALTTLALAKEEKKLAKEQDRL